MRRTNKKGFTIVELVIVIAVIAILAAVLIPTFASLVNKANQSADIQAVRQMNTILATYTDGSIKTVADAVQALDKENIDLENYKPMVKDHYFYFYVDNGTPKIVYMDKEDKVVYPEDAKTDGAQLMSLSGEVPMDGDYEVKVETNAVTVEVNSGEQFAHLMSNIASVNAKAEGKEITITIKNDIDLRGSSTSFGIVGGKLTVDAGNHTISGIRADRNTVLGSWKGESKAYGFGLINQVATGATVTVKNLNIKNVVANNTTGKASGHSAVLFGDVYGTAIVENVTIDGCSVIGADKVGSIIGYLTGTATLKSIKVTNTEVFGLGYIASGIGCVSPTAELKVESVDVKGVTTAICEDRWSELWYSNDLSWVTGKAVEFADVDTYVDGSKNTYMPWANGGMNQLQGMTTSDLYWVDNATHEGASVLDGYKVTIDGKDGGYKISGNDSRNVTNAD